MEKWVGGERRKTGKGQTETDLSKSLEDYMEEGMGVEEPGRE